METNVWHESLVETKVTYVLERNGELVVIENVPARVSPETGERFFAPDTVEQLQEIAWNEMPPSKVIETPVYEFAATQS